ncbi:erythromycin esterase family protein [Filimonas effusa]|uniref:Erythromycin esterase family protein n=1 Tax=Filimonas effusa TaxID=2508721 RepID=A0A4Q1D9Z1_9BACT|nr:erythromycin esterase family protein [Filimonas effusa]RXK85289.1 hypothetical protein ESB13_00220 [Filimonas effusa]
MRHIRIMLSVAFALCLSPGFAQTFTQTELDQVLKETKKYPVVGLGEAEHFYKGYYNAKFEILKHLVEHKSIDIIALEASMNVTALLNDYITGAIDLDLQRILPALNEPYSLEKAGLYDCAEMVGIINWLKEYNKNKRKKIKLIGFDCQNYSIPLDSLRHNTPDSLKYKLTDTRYMLDSSLYAILKNSPSVITTPQWLERFKKARQNIVDLKTMIENDKNRQLFTELEQFTFFWTDPGFRRDSLMYENLKKHIDKKSHILIWAASYHLENDPKYKVIKKMGVFIKEDYPSYYYIIGVTGYADKNKPKLIYPLEKVDSGKYNMIIRVNRGERCKILTADNQ